MKKQQQDFKVVPYSKLRRIMALTLRSAQRKPMIHGLIEVDVTRACAHLREHKFLTRHRAALTQRPVAVFALGPFHAEEKEYQEVRRQLDKELAKFSWLIPQAIAIFGGKFDPQKLTFPYNLMPALKNMPASDVRDRAVIHAWASDLAEQFQPALI